MRSATGLLDFLERERILERDEETSYLNLEEGNEDPMQQVLGLLLALIIRYRSPDFLHLRLYPGNLM